MAENTQSPLGFIRDCINYEKIADWLSSFLQPVCLKIMVRLASSVNTTVIYGKLSFVTDGWKCG